MKGRGYTIQHFDLSKDQPEFRHAEPHYWIFWYKSVPLGETYTETSQAMTEEQFFKICSTAIKPTLQMYSKRSAGALEKMNPSWENFRDVCHKTLASVLPENFPASCSVTVVICTRNRPKQLSACLERLQHQVTKPSEILVVDNASLTDETREVANRFAGVRYVREENPGLDNARNRGVIEAKTDVIAYTDDDTMPNDYWVFRVYETFRDPSVAAMTGLVMAASLETEAEIIFEKHWPFNRGYVTKIYDYNFFSATLKTGPPVWKIGAGANMAFRKDIFEEVGYFDERLDVGAAGCNGDSEQWYRILANGFTIVYNPLAVVEHSHRNSLSDLKKQLYAYMRGFTVAILIQYQTFGHKGNLRHLIKVFPFYYLTLLRKGFPFYNSQYKTVFSEMAGVVSGLFYYWKHRDR